MGVDYKKQYSPDQLEPFWPNEIVKMAVAVLCTLAVIMFLAILPSLMQYAGVEGFEQHEEPANPHGATPVGIKPEWYFLATYQYLRLMPTELVGISGKTLGVMSQGVLVAAVVLLPFWYRRKANVRPGKLYRFIVTVVILCFLTLTLWGGWPEEQVNGEEQLMPFTEYLAHNPMLFIMPAVTLIIFYFLIARERAAIRRILYGKSKNQQTEEKDVE